LAARQRSSAGKSSFAKTRWSAVLRAGRGGRSTASRAALAELSAAYWYPLYAYARRRGRDADEARDATQGFFAELLEKNVLASADPARGRFRAFLLAAFEHHAAKQRRFWRALKRGGAANVVALDFADAEARYRSEPVDERSPQKLYEASWARALIERAFARLREEYARSERAELFDRLRAQLIEDAPAESYAALGAELGLSEGALKVAIHRLRKRFRAALEREIADTVDDPADVEDELRHLFEALGR
jgi:RNA polymerase sigma-70 factor (ECF subfamily)